MKCAVVFVAALTSGSLMVDASAQHPATSNARIDMGVGHFNREGKAFHYWDKEKEIPAACARCHSATGIPQYLKEGKNTPAPHVRNGYACANCHSDMVTYERHRVGKVNFASGVALDSGDNTTNLCMTCHQGRESTASLNKAIAEKALDTPDPQLAFVHAHYLPAGAMRYGAQVKIGYEYEGKAYAGRFAHVPGMDTCTSCHDPHSGRVKEERCAACHKDGRPEARTKRITVQMSELYAAIQHYARQVGGTAIAFTPEAYPYWYADTNGNGTIDPDELKPANAYKAYTPRLLQATYNYTFVLRDPGAGTHNGRYAEQLLHDSLESLAASGLAGIETKGEARP